MCEGQLKTPDGASGEDHARQAADLHEPLGQIRRQPSCASTIWEPSDIVVFHDEIDMALGRFRMATGRSAAGHNGIKSIYQLASTEVRRGRMGVGHPEKRAR